MEDFINFTEELNNPGYVFPVIDAETFVEYLLPPPKDGIDVNLVKPILKRKGHIDSRGRWKGLWAVSEGKKRKKYDTFAPLVDIFRKVTSIAFAKAPHLEQALEMVLVPERVKDCAWINKSSQSACFSLRRGHSGITRGKEASWHNIALTASFRRTSSDMSRRKNARKVISSIQLAMARDPSRRFSFGITVENTTMRLWFCSRASPVVSAPFDFSKDLDILLRVFLSLAFAERGELGWDPTMRPVIRSDNSYAYRIDVDGETYETRETLSSSSADQLLGHATRVWRVQQLGSDGSESEDASFVLKDVWTEDDQEPEHLLVERLLNDVEEKYGTETRHKLASHLLTPVAHCFVRVNGEEDHTTNVMMRGYLPTYKEKYRVNVEHLGGDGDDGEDEDDGESGPTTEIGVDGLRRNGLKDPLHWYNPVRRIPRLKHYRMLFKEVAEPVYALRELEDVFTVLSDTAKALKWIHGAGWVHRDLSIGNLYLYQGRGLIGDFEYAKRRDSHVEDEELTGTRDFLAVEAAERRYLHLLPQDKSVRQACVKALQEGRMEDLARLQDTGRPPRFFHNDLHDLESLWWIALWKLLKHTAKFEGSIQDEERARQREVTINLLFPQSNNTIKRMHFLQTNVHYWNYLTWWPDRTLKMAMASLRSTLVKKYSKFEASFPEIQTELFDGTHALFRGLFTKCRDYIRKSKFRKNRSPGMKNSRMGPEGTKTLSLLSEEGMPGHPIGQGNLFNAFRKYCPGTECEPKIGKRKRDSIEEFPSVRPAQIVKWDNVS